VGLESSNNKNLPEKGHSEASSNILNEKDTDILKSNEHQSQTQVLNPLKFEPEKKSRFASDNQGVKRSESFMKEEIDNESSDSAPNFGGVTDNNIKGIDGDQVSRDKPISAKYKHLVKEDLNDSAVFNPPRKYG